MARPPRFLHPLREVRTIAGLTQVKLAALLGVSPVAIEKLENGRMPLSERLALTLRLRLGCVVREEPDADGGRPVFGVQAVAAETGRRYTREDFQKHTARFDVGEAESTLWLDGALEMLRVLFGAGNRAGKAPQVTADFEQFVLKAMRDHDLDAAILETLREASSRRGKAEQVRRMIEVSPIEAGREILNLSPEPPRRRS